MSSYSYVLFRNVSVSLKPETLWSPCTEDRSVRARQSEELGCSFPSCRPEIPHQWMELVLHISSTRSIILSLSVCFHIHLFCVCSVQMCMCYTVHVEVGGQAARAGLLSLFSHSSRWVLGLRLRSSCLAPSAVTQLAPKTESLVL